MEVDFSPPWKRVSILEELEKILKKEFPKELETAEAREYFDKLCKELNVPCTNTSSTSRLIDKLVA